MSQKIWNMIVTYQMGIRQRTALFVAVNVVIYGLIGFVLWAILAQLLPGFSSLDWQLAIIGSVAYYGGVIGGLIFVLLHEDEEQ